jgi:hypothetical protein
MDLIPRVKSIILSPAAEWPTIAREPNDAMALYLRYIIPLAGAAALASFIGLSMIGRMLGYGGGFFWAFGSSVMGFVFSMISIFVISKLAAFLAPKFGGVADDGAALKLVAYANTPGWVASLFFLIPPLGFLALLGLWGVYVFWLGVGPMLRVPDDKKLVFVLALAGSAILLNMLLGLILR